MALGLNVLDFEIGIFATCYLGYILPLFPGKALVSSVSPLVSLFYLYYPLLYLPLYPSYTILDPFKDWTIHILDLSILLFKSLISSPSCSFQIHHSSFLISPST